MREDLPNRFEELPSDEQHRVREAADRMGDFAFQHAVGIVVATPPNLPPVTFNTASGFVLQRNGSNYLGTAWHVVEAWQRRAAAGERVLFQAGHADLPPNRHRIWKDEQADIALLEITTADVARIGVLPCDATLGWPPPKLIATDFVLVSGYPGKARERPDHESVDLNCYAALLSVTTIGERHVVCQFQREHWITTRGLQAPPEGADLGGMSGAPALLVRNLTYPLVGIVSEHNSTYELMRISTLSHLPDVL